MNKKLSVSAIKLSAGVDSNDVAKELFGNDTFPCKKLVKNNSPKTMFFTSIKVNGSGLILRGNIQNGVHPNEAVVEFQSFDELNGFVSDIEAYADAHGYKDAVLISDIASAPAAVEDAVISDIASAPAVVEDAVISDIASAPAVVEDAVISDIASAPAVVEDAVISDIASAPAVVEDAVISDIASAPAVVEDAVISDIASAPAAVEDAVISDIASAPAVVESEVELAKSSKTTTSKTTAKSKAV